MTGVIDSFLISLGLTVDTKGVDKLKKKTEEAKESLLSVGTALKVFATGFALKGIADIGDSFEKNTIAIAGFLTALGLSSNFNVGMKDAEATLERITADAAKLPGTAEDYIEVFRAGLPVLKASMPGASITDIAAFSNQVAAIGNSLSIDAPQIGRDLTKMLGPIGRASSVDRTFMGLLTFMKELPGQAALTAESFNKMSQPERFKLLQKTMANPGLVAMIDKMSSSYDAMKGAAISMVKTLVRLSTGGLFEGMKKGLDNMRAMFVDDKNKPTELGKSVIEASEKISSAIVKIVSAGAGLAKWLVENKQLWGVFKVAAGLALAAIGGAAIGKAATGFAKLASGIKNVKALLAGGIFGVLVLVLEDIYTYLNGGNSITGILVKRFPEAFALVRGAVDVVTTSLRALRDIFAGLSQWIGPLVATLGDLTPVVVAFGAAFAFANPLGALVGAFAALINIIDALEAKWEGFRNARREIQRFFGTYVEDPTEPNAMKNFKSPEFKRTEGPLRPGEKVGSMFRREIAPEDFLTKRPSASLDWSPASAVVAGASGGSSDSHDLHVNGPVTVVAKDPKEMKRELQRGATRNSQSKVGL